MSVLFCFGFGFGFLVHVHKIETLDYPSRKLIDDPQGGNCVREKWKKGWSYQGRAESWYET